MKLFSKVHSNTVDRNNSPHTMVALIDLDINLISATISKHKEFFFSNSLPIRRVEVKYPKINLYSCNVGCDIDSLFPNNASFDLNFLKVDDDFNMTKFTPYPSLKAERVMVMDLNYVYWSVSTLTASGSKIYTSNLMSCSSDFGLNTVQLN